MTQKYRIISGIASVVLAMVGLVVWRDEIGRIIVQTPPFSTMLISVDTVPTINIRMRHLEAVCWEYVREYGALPEGDWKVVSQALLGKNPEEIEFFDHISWVNDAGELIDIWGTPFELRRESDAYVIVSAGPDRVFGDGDDVKRSLRFPATEQ